MKGSAFFREPREHSLVTESIPRARVERVLVVQRALRIGFTLAELAEVLKARDAGGAPCHRVYQLAQDKLKGIEADIEALKRTKRYLKKVLSDWEQRIQRAGPGQKSHLLYSLSDAAKELWRSGKSISEEREIMKTVVALLLFAGCNWRRKTCSLAPCTKST